MQVLYWSKNRLLVPGTLKQLSTTIGTSMKPKTHSKHIEIKYQKYPTKPTKNASTLVKKIRGMLITSEYVLEGVKVDKNEL